MTMFIIFPKEHIICQKTFYGISNKTNVEMIKDIVPSQLGSYISREYECDVLIEPFENKKLIFKRKTDDEILKQYHAIRITSKGVLEAYLMCNNCTNIKECFDLP